MPRHIYFVAPEKSSPTGGVNVIYQLVSILQDHGYASSVHYQSSDFLYEFINSEVDCTYSHYSEPRPTLRRAPYEYLARGREAWRKPRRPGANQLSIPDRRDLVVLPDFWSAQQLSRFPDVPIAVLAQDVSGIIRGTLLPMLRNNIEIQNFRGFITTSKAADAAVEAFSDAPRKHVPLFLNKNDFQFQEIKKRQICFLDRKRRDQVEAMREFLKRDLEKWDFKLVTIRNLPTADLQKIMAESLFFLSFSYNEGFGLPPAEAMAMGCMAIGYTGVGGNEYFTPDVAFPVPENDIVAFYNKVLEVVKCYSLDPKPIDAMRRKASEKILTTFTKEETTRALLDALDAFGGDK